VERIDRIGPRTDGVSRLVPVSPARRVERREPDPERRERRDRPAKRRPPPPPPAVEGGHVDVSV
jgi:hypothetical protein